MGVQGLTSFLANHQMIYREVQFRRSRLVIDGCNLNYLLYFKSGLDENHGGEYAAYRNLIENFITALRTCEITPYVVLDGGSDVTDKKVETVSKRSKDRVQRAHQAAVSGKQMRILPRMAELVFKQTLARLEVPVAQCYEEADQEIAALASEWHCPVLSDDSDFYIFDLPAGLLPISGFQWKEVKHTGSQNYISCRRYYRSSFCAFVGLQHQLMPTFAALAGNDYVKLRGINWAQFVPAGSKTSSHLEGLVCWLKKFRDPQDALEAALILMGELSEKKKKEVLQTLHLGMEYYQPCRSSLSRFFLHGVPPEFPALEEEADLIPNWMLLPLTQARLFAYVLDVLRLQTIGLGCAVEPQDSPSTNLTSSSLRQVMYGLLLGSRKSIQVDEIDRDGLLVTSIPVKPKSTSVGKSLVLNSLNEAALSDRLNVLLEALGGTEESLRLLPPQLKLPAAVTCYWMQRAQPPPDLSLLKALLLGMSNGNMLRSRTALQNNGHKQKVDMHVAYAFNQWQACLRDSIRLNQLLHFPLPEPDVAGLYQGTLVHQLVHMIRTGGGLKTFLKSDRPSVELYRTMLSMVLQFHAQQLLVPSKNHQKGTTDQQQKQSLKNLSTDLQQLFLVHQDEETEKEVQAAITAQEELQLEEELLVRTRYRTKDRSNRCKKPELARKEECRGWDLL